MHYFHIFRFTVVLMIFNKDCQLPFSITPIPLVPLHKHLFYSFALLSPLSTFTHFVIHIILSEGDLVCIQRPKRITHDCDLIVWLRCKRRHVDLCLVEFYD